MRGDLPRERLELLVSKRETTPFELLCSSVFHVLLDTSSGLSRAQLIMALFCEIGRTVLEEIFTSPAGMLLRGISVCSP